VACAAASRQQQASPLANRVASAVLTGALAAALLVGQPVEAAGVRVKGFASNAGEEGSEKYQGGVGKKAAQAARRKAGLAAKRAEALAAGGASDMTAPSLDTRAK